MHFPTVTLWNAANFTFPRKVGTQNLNEIHGLQLCYQRRGILITVVCLIPPTDDS
jgi:hypothetical protein